MKNFLIAFVFLFSSNLFSQININPSNECEEIIFQNVNPSNQLVSLSTPIWEEDFSSGFPANWSKFTSNTVSGLSTCNWQWTTDGTYGYYNGNQGVSGSNDLTSSSASNGFLISDIDSANHYAYGQPSGSTYEYIESYFTTDAIDLSSYSAVSLEFEHLFRYNNLGNGSFTPPTVYISSDSINWTTYLVNNNIANNTQSSNPEITSLNISSVAGNQSTVYIKFGWVARCYYWMIDDIKIVETDPNRLEISEMTYGGWWIGYQTTGDIGIDYTFNPMAQVSSNPYRVEAIVKNNGGSAQTTTKLNINIEEGGASVFTAFSNPIISTVNSNDTLAAKTDFYPSNYGYHDLSVWATSDSFPSTDTLVKGSIVTDTVYGVDYDWNTDGANAGNGFYLGRSCGGQVLANAFDIYENTTLTSISFHVNDKSVVGAELNVELYETNGQVWLEESDSYTLKSTDIDSWVTLPLLTPYPLFAGTSYMAAVKGQQHPTDTSLISSTTNPNTSRYLQDNCGTGTWYTVSKALLIRMNFGISTSVIDIENKKTFDVYPNPSLGFVNVFSSDLTDFEVNIINCLGQIVFTKRNIMDSNLELNLNSLKSGVYTLSVSDINNMFSRRIIIK